MFSGIVEEIGVAESLVQSQRGWSLTVRAHTILEGIALGHSLAVNGVCLTVTKLTASSCTMGLSPETLRRTNLGDLQSAQEVNLERSLPANGRIGGHFVQGHVDGTGRLQDRQPEGDSLWLTIQASRELLQYVVPKGFIAVDGVSLTVVEALLDAFTFMLVPYTQENTTLARKPLGCRLNLEADVLGKYVFRYLEKDSDAVC